MNLAKLSEPFPSDAVHWRVQGQPYPRDGKNFAMALPYLDARDVMDKLDEVCGPENWQSEYTETAKGRIICRIGLNIYNGTSTPNWIWKSDGAGDTAVEGEKGALSDALKRAAVSWGVGRYLYRIESPWVECEVSQKNGKTYWKKWAVDPWLKVKIKKFAVQQEQSTEDAEPKKEAAPAKPKAAAPATDADRRNWFKTTMAKADSREKLHDWWTSKNISAGVAALPEPMLDELTAEYNRLFDEMPAPDLAGDVIPY